MGPVAILSPHPDDAVFSLWHMLAGPGEVSVVNVFAGAPTTDELGWWDAETGAVDPLSRARQRREEDRAALALAGRDAVDLDFLDAQYREAGQPVEPIADAIAAAAPKDALLMAPGGLGAHPDHLLARAAGLSLGRRGRRVGIYADVPHAARHGWPAWVTDGAAAHRDDEVDRRWRADLNGCGGVLVGVDPAVEALDSRQVERKLEALAEYRSQLPALDAEFSLRARPEILSYEVVWAS